MTATQHSTKPVCAREDVRVRLWQPGDSARLVEISNWAAANTTAHFRCPDEIPEQWEVRLGVTTDRHPCLVAEREGQPVGYAAGQAFSGGCGFAGAAEVSVYVHHEHARAGIATMLYEGLIPTLTNQGYRRLVASITVPNPASECLHERFGFCCVGVLARVGWKFGRWHDVAYWQRDLFDSDRAPTPIGSATQAFAAAEAN